MPPADHWVVCKAKRSDGQPCRSPAIKGGRVCRVHGGSTRHIREAANKRIDELVMPAVSKLRVLMLRGESHAIQLKAAESILDRAGIVAERKVELDNQVTISVSYQDVELARQVLATNGVSEPSVIDVSYALGDGQEKTAPKGGQSNGHVED
jgi:hypothetical protein